VRVTENLIDEVLALEERRRQALLAGDWDAVAALLSEALVYVHSTGASDDRASYLRKLREGQIRYRQLAFEGLRVGGGPDLALVHGGMRAEVLKPEGVKAVASRYLVVWAREPDGRTRLLAHQGTPVAAEPAIQGRP